MGFLASATPATAFSSPSSATSSLRPRAASTMRGDTSLSMALTLYGSPGSRSPLVNWAANELDLTLEAGDLAKNPHPFGQIPCLTDDGGVTVFESGAILNYLLSKADGKGAIGDPRLASVTSWIAWANASLDPICFLETPEGKALDVRLERAPISNSTTLTQHSRSMESSLRGRYDTGLRSANKRIDRLDSLLSDASYLVPGGFSLADVAVASYLLYVIQFFPDVDLHSKWPNIVRYMKDCASREGYEKAFGGRTQGNCLERLGEMEKGGGKEKKLFGVF
ncbi:hypothetical protein ACHAWF_015703 [Thalassiosira exigua]